MYICERLGNICFTWEIEKMALLINLLDSSFLVHPRAKCPIIKCCDKSKKTISCRPQPLDWNQCVTSRLYFYLRTVNEKTLRDTKGFKPRRSTSLISLKKEVWWIPIPVWQWLESEQFLASTHILPPSIEPISSIRSPTLLKLRGKLGPRVSNSMAVHSSLH